MFLSVLLPNPCWCVYLFSADCHVLSRQNYSILRSVCCVGVCTCIFISCVCMCACVCVTLTPCVSCVCVCRMPRKDMWWPCDSSFTYFTYIFTCGYFAGTEDSSRPDHFMRPITSWVMPVAQSCMRWNESGLCTSDFSGRIVTWFCSCPPPPPPP